MNTQIKIQISVSLLGNRPCIKMYKAFAHFIFVKFSFMATSILKGTTSVVVFGKLRRKDSINCFKIIGYIYTYFENTQ